MLSPGSLTASPTNDSFPPPLIDGTCTHLCYVALMEPTRQAYMDLTGKFVAPSSTGNNYILVVYNYNSNGILAVPIKTQCSEAILEAYQSAHTHLCNAGLRPMLQHLDNEAS